METYLKTYLVKDKNQQARQLAYDDAVGAILAAVEGLPLIMAQDAIQDALEQMGGAK